MPPLSMRTPGGRRTAPASASTEISRQRERGVGPRGAPRRGEAQRDGERQRPPEVGAVAGGLELAEQRGVDQPAAALRRVADGLREAQHQWGGGHGRARVGVERRQLAAWRSKRVKRRCQDSSERSASATASSALPRVPSPAAHTPQWLPKHANVVEASVLMTAAW